MSQVWDSNVGPAVKRLVLLALADSANDEGVCWPSIGTLSGKAGASRRRTEEVLAELAGEGLVTKRQRYNDSNVYTLQLDGLTPREIRTPREKVGAPPAKSAGPPREEVGPNRKGTQREPKQPADAPASEPALDLPEVEDELAKRRVDRRELESPPLVSTLNQRANLLAGRHYERLGKMGNVPAFIKIIKKALEHGYTDEQVDKACAWLADRRWTLTEEKLANTLRGGPQRAGTPPTTTDGPVLRTGRMILET